MRRKDSDLGTFHKESTTKGITYAEAQIQETCELIGKIRAPKGEQSDGKVYSKISDRKGDKNASKDNSK